DAQTRSGCFVAISRADAALGGADFVFTFENLALRIEFAVVRENEMGRFAQVKITVDLDAELAESLDFFNEADGIDADGVADAANLFLAQYSGRDEVEDILLAADVNGVAGVVAALSADNDVRLFSKDIDNFAFSFVAPLGTHQNRICHSFK